MKYLSDDRRGVPSASGLERLALCPGSWRMERDIPLGVGHGHQAELGIRLHEVLAGMRDISELSARQRRTVNACWEHAEQLLAEIGLGDEHTRRIVEERLWMYYPDRSPAFSARMDLAAVRDDHGAVIDYKTGGSLVTPPPENYQLRAQAVLMSRHYNLNVVHAAIIQPSAREPVMVARYSADDLRESERELFIALRAAQQDGAPLQPGYVQCRHCRARQGCGAWKGEGGR